MPLAFLVVCVHADFTKKFSYAGEQVNCAYDIGYHIVNFVSHTFADIAVPLFYLISGMLCFYSIKKHGYRNLLEKKSTTLLLPYITWNLIFFIAFYLDKGYTTYEFIKGFWFSPKGGAITGVLTQPWDGPLWFLRDLMVVFLLTPIIIFLLRKVGFLFIFAVYFLYATKITPWYIFPGFSITCLLMFSLGIYLQMIDCNWFDKIKKRRLELLITSTVCMVITYVYSVIEKDTTSLFYNLLHSTYILLGIGTALAVASISPKTCFMEKWGRNTFVVFASHSLFLTYVIKIVMFPFGHDIDNMETVFIYLFSCFVTYVISFIVGEIIGRNAWLIKLLTGGR